MKNLCLLLFGLWLWVHMTMCFPSGVLQDGLSHKRTKRETGCNSAEEYSSHGMCCLSCPAGTYAEQPCVKNHQRGVCQPCSLGEGYTSGPNGLESCVSCRVCRKDQIMVQECTLTSNRICQCKPGRYCVPGEACEECSYCSGCGAGQRIKEECNATKNTVCENIPVTQPTSNMTGFYLPPTNIKTTISPTPELDVTKNVSSTTEKDISKSTNPTNENGSYWVPFIILLIVIIVGAVVSLIIAALYWVNKKRTENRKKHQANSRDHLTGSSKNTSASSSKNSTPLIERANQDRAEQLREEQLLLTASNDPEQPTRALEQKEHSTAKGPQSSKDPGPGGDDCGGGGGGTTQDNEVCMYCSQSPPCDCYWTDCFECIIRNVSSELIFRLVRLLHVPRVDIDHIKEDNPNKTYEQCMKLLEKWRMLTGKQASMKSVFRVLEEMEQGGCVENIINSLRCKNIAVV